MSKNFIEELTEILEEYRNAKTTVDEKGVRYPPSPDKPVADIKRLLRTHRPEKLEHKYEDEAEALYDWEARGWNAALSAVDKAYGLYIDTLFMNPNPPRPNTPSVREYCLEHGVIIGDTVTLKFEALNHLIDQRVETTLKALQSADSSGSHKLTKGGWSRPVSAPKSQARTRPGGQ